MADPIPVQRNEAAATAYMMSKEAPINAPRNPAELRKAKIAEKIWEKIRAGEGHKALEIPAQPKYDQAQIDLRIDQFGIQRNERGQRVLTRNEQAWQDNARADAALIGKVLEGKYASNDITIDERAQIRRSVVNAITRNPDLAAEFYALQTYDRQNAFIDRHIQDPRFMAEVRRGMEALSKAPDFQDGYTDAALTLQEKAREREAAVEEIQEIDRQMRQVQRRMEAFDRTGLEGPGIGDRARGLNESREQLIEAKGRLSELKTGREELEDRVAELNNELTRHGRNAPERQDILTQIADANNAIRQTDRRIKRTEGEIRELGTADVAGTESDEGRIEDRMADLRREKAQKQKEIDRIDGEIQRGVITVEDAIRAREAAEQSYAGKLRDIWAEAATVVANEDLARISSEFNRVLDEQEGEIRSEAAKAGKKKIRSLLDRKIVTNNWGRRKERTVINKAKAREYSSMIVDQGPEAVAVKILSSTVNPDTGVNYTPQEAHALVENKEFMSEFEPIMAQEIFGRMLRSDKKGFTQEDAQQIAQSDWGERMIDSALQGNQAFKDQVEKIYGQGAASQPGAASRLAREIGSKQNLGFLLVSALLGPVVLAGLGNYAYQAHKAGNAYA